MSYLTLSKRKRSKSILYTKEGDPPPQKKNENIYGKTVNQMYGLKRSNKIHFLKYRKQSGKFLHIKRPESLPEK